MGWAYDDDAVCDNGCSRYRSRGSREKTVASLRVAGWRHWDGTDLAGREHEVILCPKCAAPARSIRKKNTLTQDTLEGM